MTKEFSVKEFMAAQHDNLKTVEENMKTLGATKEAIEYAMHIINAKQASLERLKNTSPYQAITDLGKKLTRMKREMKNVGIATQEGRGESVRRILPFENRELKTTIVPSGRVPKITINPCSGRVEVKFPDDKSDAEKIAIYKIADLAIEHEGYEPFTYRGNIKFYNETVYVNLKRESKGHEKINFVLPFKC